MTSFVFLGTMAFWGLMVTAALMILCTVETSTSGKGRMFGPVLTTVITSFLLVCINRHDILTLIHGMTWSGVLVFGGSYFVAGLIWSFFRWFTFVKKRYQWYKRSHGNDPDFEKAKKSNIPLAKEHKEELSAWIVFWPFSMIRYVLGDLFKDLINAIVTTFQKTYNSIAQKVFEG